MTLLMVGGGRAAGWNVVRQPALLLRRSFSALRNFDQLNPSTKIDGIHNDRLVRLHASMARSADTTAVGKLAVLRSLMVEEGLDAYIVPSDDPHLSEYVAPCYERRAFLSGFTGSAGTAVVLREGGAYLWTDGRYWLQAEQQLDAAAWTLMKQGSSGCPEIARFLVDTLSPRRKSSAAVSGGAAAPTNRPAVGIDPFVHPASVASELARALEGGSIDLKPLSRDGSGNLVDVVWGRDRPSAPKGRVRVHPVDFAGASVEEKLRGVRIALDQAKADALVAASLDEVAYLFNIRGADIACCPVVLAYAIVEKKESGDGCDAKLYIDAEKLDADVKNHLTGEGVAILPYETVQKDLRVLVKDAGKRLMVDPKRVNYGLLAPLGFGDGKRDEKMVDRDRKEGGLVEVANSPISESKALKNDGEIRGMISAHERDGAAVANFMCWLEKTVAERPISEVEIDESVTSFRREQPGFLDVSFPTIAGADGNGAIIHYRAEPGSCGAVDKDTLLLLDSGAQYDCGTTDVTRTMHTGTPTEAQRECFTRVLKGNIALDTTIFPENTPGFVLDVFARRSLWAAGLDYAHGTGHGVGAALNVHEGPQSISPRFGNTNALKAGMVLSNEPGFYSRGEFGIRIENLLYVVPVDASPVGKTEEMTKAAAAGGGTGEGKRFLGFKRLTHIPIQKKLLDVRLMSNEELDWLDAYHRDVFDRVYPLLTDERTKEWLYDATSPIERNGEVSNTKKSAVGVDNLISS